MNELTFSCLACETEQHSAPYLQGEFRYELDGEQRLWAYSLVQCSQCGFGRLIPSPSDDDLRAMYSEEYEAYTPLNPATLQSRSRQIKMAVATLAAFSIQGSTPVPLRKLAAVATRALEELGRRSVPVTTSYPLSLGTSARILDYGCGAGWWLQVMMASAALPLRPIMRLS